jgi:hypothetical protein
LRRASPLIFPFGCSGSAFYTFFFCPSGTGEPRDVQTTI